MPCKWAVVVPTCRPDSFENFMQEWNSLFKKHNAKVFVVFDGDSCPTYEGTHMCLDWSSENPVEDYSIFPVNTDMIRSLGFYHAWKEKPEYILSLDDDVYPIADIDIFEEYEKVFNSKVSVSSYLGIHSLTTCPYELRGFPYHSRDGEVAVQYGGWAGVLDHDGVTALSEQNNLKRNEAFYPITMVVPNGAAATCCAMNFAFKRKYTPLFYQLPLLGNAFNRFGDIWSGLFAKKILDAAGAAMVINGKASVAHLRKSNVFDNIAKESIGLKLNEELWDNLDLIGDFEDIKIAYLDIIDSASTYFYLSGYTEYSEGLSISAEKWISLFEEE